MKKIAMGRVDIARAHSWFKEASTLPDMGSLDTSLRLQENLWEFMKALVNLVLHSTSTEIIPHTFLFDEERLIKLRTDVLDLINLEICMHMFHSLEATNRSREARSLPPYDTPLTSFRSSPHNRPASLADDGMLSLPTLPSEHHFRMKPKVHDVQQQGHFLSRPSSRQAWVQNIEKDVIDSASSSPRSSSSSSASTPAYYSPSPLYLSPPVSYSAKQAQSSFQAILASDTSAEKWTSLSPALALQILRSTNTSLTRLPQFESHLAFHLSNPRSNLYQEIENRILSQLFPILQKLIKTYSTLTSLQIFEAATAPKPALGRRANGPKDETTEIATRIAHIGILHWRVWAPLAYLVDPDAEGETPKARAGSAP